MNILDKVQRKLLIVLNYYDGDKDQMMELCKLIADLEPSVSPIADILLYRRNDATTMPDDIKNRLLGKFAKVHVLKCRRLNAVGYPYGPNELFYDLVEKMRGPDWTKEYYAFLNMEADCVPLSPNWIQALAREYRTVSADGNKHIVGHIHATPQKHVNGAAIYSTNIYNLAGGMDLLGGPADIAYDFYQSSRFLPVASDTSLMVLDFNRKTITADDLFNIRKNGAKPVFVHGIKDASALTAVRSKYIDQDANISDLSLCTVCTYFQPQNGDNHTEDKALLELWKHAWKSVGWNPIVNTEWDARKHKAYPSFKEAIAKEKAKPDILKWLCLDQNGGGIYADISTFPGAVMTPVEFPRKDGLVIYQTTTSVITKPKPIQSFITADRNALSLLIESVKEAVEKMKQGDNVMDDVLKSSFVKTENMVRDIGTKGWEQGWIVSLSADACSEYAPGSPRSFIADKYMARLYL